MSEGPGGGRDGLRRPEPILVVDRFPPMLDALVELLAGLADEEWEAPTVGGSWSVKDLALHLIGGDIGILSRGRDGYRVQGSAVTNWADLVTLINQLNEQWVVATRRISPRFVCELMQFTGAQACDYFRSLDPYATGGPVSWAGPEPAPVWLDIAREYTERWHHQQQIRDAVGRPGLTEAWYVAPVLDTFVRALPYTFRAVEAAEGSCVTVTVAGDAGGQWSLRRENGAWQLYRGRAQACDAAVSLPQAVAWRLFTKGTSVEEARGMAMIDGKEELGLKVLEMVSVIA